MCDQDAQICSGTFIKVTDEWQMQLLLLRMGRIKRKHRSCTAWTQSSGLWEQLTSVPTPRKESHRATQGQSHEGPEPRRAKQYCIFTSQIQLLLGWWWNHQPDSVLFPERTEGRTTNWLTAAEAEREQERVKSVLRVYPEYPLKSGWKRRGVASGTTALRFKEE